jgi:hypothetical protein
VVPYEVPGVLVAWQLVSRLQLNADPLDGAARACRCCLENEIDKFLSEWHRVVSAKDLGGLLGLLGEDVSLGAPPYLEKLHGRDLVHHLLGLILNTIDEFTYHRQWQNEGELALEFTGRVGDLQLQGIDLITLNDHFAIGNLDVLIRPTNAVDALRDVIAPQMASFLFRASQGAV